MALYSFVSSKKTSAQFSCQHGSVQRFNTQHPIGVPKIVEITYAIYRGRYVEGIHVCRKEKSTTTRLGLISIFSTVITWIEPAIQSKNQYLGSGQLQKTRRVR